MEGNLYLMLTYLGINLHLRKQTMDWTTKLAKRGIKILFQDEENLVLETYNLLDTLCYVTSSNRWIIDELIPDDFYRDGRKIERNILSYKRKQHVQN